MLTDLMISFLSINAIFWGLFRHDTHCQVAKQFGVKKCPPHYVHLLLGVACFLIAVVLKHYEYISSIII